MPVFYSFNHQLNDNSCSLCYTIFIDRVHKHSLYFLYFPETGRRTRNKSERYRGTIKVLRRQAAAAYRLKCPRRLILLMVKEEWRLSVTGSVYRRKGTLRMGHAWGNATPGTFRRREVSSSRRLQCRQHGGKEESM